MLFKIQVVCAHAEHSSFLRAQFVLVKLLRALNEELFIDSSIFMAIPSRETIPLCLHVQHSPLDQLCKVGIDGAFGMISQLNVHTALASGRHTRTLVAQQTFYAIHERCCSPLL
jgi:hypothetical protein